MPALQYIIRCSPGRKTCVTVYKCCCFDSSGNSVLAPGVSVSISLNGTTVASGTTDDHGVFCFYPCEGGNYTLTLSAQGNCSAGSITWQIDVCGGPDIGTTQRLTPGYYCCNGVQVPSQVIVTDSNGSFTGSLISGASAFADNLAHAGDTFQQVLVQKHEWTSSSMLCFHNLLSNPCNFATHFWAADYAWTITPGSGPFSYGYGLTCTRDESGTYLQASVGYIYGRDNTKDPPQVDGFLCCTDDEGNILGGNPDCGSVPVSFPINWEPGPYGIPCVITDPVPMPRGPCDTRAHYGNGFLTDGVSIPSNKVYLGDPCSLATGPWTFSFEAPPGITWTFTSPWDCDFGHAPIAPPPPGGTSITVSGYFP